MTLLNLFDSTIQVQLERHEKLIGINISINERDGAYSEGGLTFDVTPGCTSWYEQNKGNKAKLAEFLKKVAEKMLQENV